jgi:hypothetical protein
MSLFDENNQMTDQVVKYSTNYLKTLLHCVRFNAMSLICEYPEMSIHIFDSCFGQINQNCVNDPVVVPLFYEYLELTDQTLKMADRYT